MPHPRDIVRLTTRSVSLGVALALAFSGCDEQTLLAIDVRTDLVPGLEMERVRVTVQPSDGVERAHEEAILTSNDYVAGARVAEWRGLPKGTARIEVALLDADGAVVLERPVQLELRAQRVVTVLLTRACRDVTCPMDGDEPAATACRAGRCVSPECTDDAPEACAPFECSSAADCAASAACLAPMCSEGACLYVAEDDRCPGAATCDPLRGCVSTDETDGGADAAILDDAGLDGGAPAVLPSWAHALGGSGDDEALAVTVTTAGRACVAGRFEATANIAGDALVSAGATDAFVACFEADGAPAWSIRFGGVGVDIAQGIAADSDGGVWVVGAFEGSVPFGGEVFVADGTDGFVLHVDSAGAVVEAVHLGGAGHQDAAGVAITDAAEVVVVGAMEGDVDFGGAAGVVSSTGSRDAFVARYDASARARWALAFGGGYDFATAVAVDAAHVWVTGAYEGDLGVGATSVGAADGEDAFLVQLSADGVVRGAFAFGGPENEQGHAVTANARQVAMGGWFFGGATHRPSSEGALSSVGSGDGFVLRSSPDGSTVLGSHAIGSSGFERVLGLASTNAPAVGTVCATGELEGTVEFQGRPLVSAGAGDAFVVCFDDVGASSAAFRFGGSADDYGTAIAAAPDGALYVVGRFGGSAAVVGETLRSAGGADGFLVRWSE